MLTSLRHRKERGFETVVSTARVAGGSGSRQVAFWPYRDEDFAIASAELRRERSLVPRSGVLWNPEHARVLPSLFREFELPGLVASHVHIRRPPSPHHHSS